MMNANTCERMPKYMSQHGNLGWMNSKDSKNIASEFYSILMLVEQHIQALSS